jgi:hypothetical protein
VTKLRELPLRRVGTAALHLNLKDNPSLGRYVSDVKVDESEKRKTEAFELLKTLTSSMSAIFGGR